MTKAPPDLEQIVAWIALALSLIIPLLIAISNNRTMKAVKKLEVINVQRIKVVQEFIDIAYEYINLEGESELLTFKNAKAKMYLFADQSTMNNINQLENILRQKYSKPGAFSREIAGSLVEEIAKSFYVYNK